MTQCPRCNCPIGTDSFCPNCGLQLFRRNSWKGEKVHFATKEDVESWHDGYYSGDGT